MFYLNTYSAFLIFFCILSSPVSAFASDVKDSSSQKSSSLFLNLSKKEWSEKDLYSQSVIQSVHWAHGLEVSVVLFRNSSWTETLVQKRFRRAAEVLTQCGIMIDKVNVVEVTAPEDLLDIDYHTKHNDERIVQSFETRVRPTFYYVRSDLNGQGAYSWLITNHASPALTNTVWITKIIRQWEKSNFNRDDCAEAHELGHVLGNLDHTDDGESNFMAKDIKLINSKITSEQCKLMNNSPLLHRLPK